MHMAETTVPPENSGFRDEHIVLDIAEEHIYKPWWKNKIFDMINVPMYAIYKRKYIYNFNESGRRYYKLKEYAEIEDCEKFLNGHKIELKEIFEKTAHYYEKGKDDLSFILYKSEIDKLENWRKRIHIDGHALPTSIHRKTEETDFFRNHDRIITITLFPTKYEELDIYFVHTVPIITSDPDFGVNLVHLCKVLMDEKLCFAQRNINDWKKHDKKVKLKK